MSLTQSRREPSSTHSKTCRWRSWLDSAAREWAERNLTHVKVESAFAVYIRDGGSYQLKHRVLDLRIQADRDYLLGRGFVWAVIYPHGEKCGKLISAHKGEYGVKHVLKTFVGSNQVEVVKIAEFRDA